MPGADQRIESIVLGTVQLGLGYGRRSNKAPPQRIAAFRVFEAAWALGIRAFDTAVAYGSASERLAAWLSSEGRLADCDITTKVRASPAVDPDIVRRACAPFAGARTLTVLAHDMVDESGFAALRSAARGVGAESGLSVYTADEVVKAAQLGARRVQGPGSIVDDRQLAAAHHARLAFDARSVFLQGILLDGPQAAERRVSGMGAVARAVAWAARESGLRPASALLAAMLGKLESEDRLVLGFDTPGQLDCIPGALAAHLDATAAFERAFRRRCPPIAPSSLDPRSW
jgi:aryl-alcohol dehydrogenase-like predicted oxidoreductase